MEVVIEVQPVYKTMLVLSFNNFNAPIKRFKNMNYFYLILKNKNVFKTNWKSSSDNYISLYENFQY